MSQLKIKDYKVSVHLGCSAAEKLKPQPVVFNIEINFVQPIKAEQTDQIEDSVNYEKLIEIIKLTAKEKPYNMIEHLCFCVLQNLKKFIDGKIQGQLTVQLSKMQVPVENLQGGTEWSCHVNL